MKIRRKSEKATRGPSGVDGVPPLHTLITCTYQKLFKKDGFMLVGGLSNGAPTTNAAHGGGVTLGHGTTDHKSHRHERGNSWGVRETKVETKLEIPVGGADEGRSRHGDGPDDSTPTPTMTQEDLHEARTNPLLPKRRKVKSTRYAEFSDKFSEEVVNVTPPSTKPEKRSRNLEKTGSLTGADLADYNNTVANSKEALIASIFYVFDTLGKSGLTASEVVAIMLEQTLPGLKEGGARHTVQVANVLRRSRHFLSIGNKQYLPCSVSEDPIASRKHGRHGHGQGSSSRSKPGRPVCKLYDGSGWFCPREAQTGFSLCAHHLDSINRPMSHCPVVPMQLQLQSQFQSPPPSQVPSSRLQDCSKTPSLQGDSPPRLSNSSFDLGSQGEPESDSDREDSEDIGPALAKWGRDRTPGSGPNQKRKMLSLCSIK